MVSILWGVIAFSSGLMFYLLPAAFGGVYPPDIQKKVGSYYLNMFMKTFRRAALIKRELGEMDLKRPTIDQEKPSVQVTFSTGPLGDDHEEHFQDPDNRMKRLFGKPFFFLHESIDSVIDLELSELGYWWHQHCDSGRHEKESLAKIQQNGQEVTVTNKKMNPYFQVSDSIRSVNLDHVIHLVLFGSKPADSKTMEHFTKKRFEKYGSNIGVAETVGTLMGFAVGVTAIVIIRYVNRNILDNTGGVGDSPVTVPLGYIDVTPLVDLMGVIT